MTDNVDLLRKVKSMILCIFSIPEILRLHRSISKFLNLYAGSEHYEIPQFSSINFLDQYYRKFLMNTLKLEASDLLEV